MTIEQFTAMQAEMSNNELIKRAEEEVTKLALTGSKSHRMCIPPLITDTDMILSEVIKRFKAIINNHKSNI